MMQRGPAVELISNYLEMVEAYCISSYKDIRKISRRFEPNVADNRVIVTPTHQDVYITERKIICV